MTLQVAFQQNGKKNNNCNYYSHIHQQNGRQNERNKKLTKAKVMQDYSSIVYCEWVRER